MKGKRDPWLRLAGLVFGERRDPNSPEVQALTRQIDDGYVKTGKRKRAVNTRDRERTVLVVAFGLDRLKGTLGKQFLNDCIRMLEKEKCAPPKNSGEWSHNTVRLLIKEIRKPRPAPRPFHEPAPDFDDGDM